jgi:endo-1,4-beta-mannosidase
MVVQDTFFGTEVNKGTTPVITIPVKSMRIWDDHTNWFQVCLTSNSDCNWDRLDRWLAFAKRNGISDVLYTIARTPVWASSDPNARFCPICDPPRDLTPDGSGSDALFKGFIHAIVDHNRRLDRSTHATIRYWGMWNEADAKNYWKGTPAQLVRMTKDARAIIKEADPDALILTPEVASNERFRKGGDWLDQYLAAGVENTST